MLCSEASGLKPQVGSQVEEGKQEPGLSLQKISFFSSYALKSGKAAHLVAVTLLGKEIFDQVEQLYFAIENKARNLLQNFSSIDGNVELDRISGVILVQLP